MKRVTGIFFLALLLQGCKDPADPPGPGEITDCIVTDLARLESIAIFPSDHPLNRDISADSTDPRSDAIIRLIGAPEIHCDFGNGLWNGSPIGIPFILVCGSQTKIPVVFRSNGYDGNYGDESDPGPYPVPLTAPVEGNGQADSHVLAVDLDNLMLYELYNASPDTRNGRITSFSPVNQVILRAMKKYGLIFADIGADFYIGGAPDERWNNDELRELKRLTAAQFEVVKMGTVVRPD